MFKKLVFYVGNKCLEVNGQSFPLGEISRNILNFPEDKYKEILEVDENSFHYCEKYKETKDEEYLLKANEYYLKLDELVQSLPIVKLIHNDPDILYNVREYTTQISFFDDEEFAKAEESEIDEFIKSANEVLEKHAKDTGDINVTVEDLISKEAVMDKPDMKKYYEYVMDYHFIVSDIVSFIRTIQNFISQHLQDLSTLNPENYAAALYHFLNREDSHKLIANPLSGTGDFYDKEPVILKYDSKETEPSSGKYKIYEQYETNIFMTLLKTDFYKALEAGHLIRRCQFCKKYFITKKGYHTKYCSNTVPGRPNITCKQMAYALGNPKELAADDPIFQAHYRCKMRIRQDCTRGRINKDDKQTLLDKADEFVFAATISPEISIETLEDQLSTANLCKECKVERKANPVGKPKKKPTMEVKS